jgi:hypothetical protein
VSPRTWTPRTVPCAACGKRFLQRQKGQRFHSEACSHGAMKKQDGARIRGHRRACSRCGRLFYCTEERRRVCGACLDEPSAYAIARGAGDIDAVHDLLRGAEHDVLIEKAKRSRARIKAEDAYDDESEL